MRISEELIDDFVVLLNGRRIIDWVEADDEEGWVTIPDLSALEQEQASDDISDPEGWIELPIIKKEGKVTLVQLKK